MLVEREESIGDYEDDYECVEEVRAGRRSGTECPPKPPEVSSLV